MKLMMNLMITALVVASQVVAGCDRGVYNATTKCRSETPVRPKVLVHHQDLLARMVGPVDKASQTLSYGSTLPEHVATPRNLGGFPLLPVVHHQGNIVYCLDTKKPETPKTKSRRRMVQVPVKTKTEQERFEDAVRSTILAYALQQKRAQSLDDTSPAQ